MKDAKEDVSNGDVKVLDADAKRSESEKKTPLQMMHANLKLLSKAVATKENRTINRVLRQSFAMRKQFTYDMAEKLLNVVLSDVESRDELLGLLHKVCLAKRRKTHQSSLERLPYDAKHVLTSIVDRKTRGRKNAGGKRKI